MCRLSRNHAGHSPKSARLSYLCDRSEYVTIPWPGLLPIWPTSCSPFADHDVATNGDGDQSSGGSTSAVCCFHGRLGSKIQVAGLCGGSSNPRNVAIREPSGDHAGNSSPPPSVSCCSSLPSGLIFHSARCPLRPEIETIHLPSGDQRDKR